MHVYSFFDTKAESYTPPFLAENDAVAQRIAAELCLKSDLPFSKFPGDFVLFRIAGWEPDNGIVMLKDNLKINLGNCLELVAGQKPVKIEPVIPSKLGDADNEL